MNYTRRMRPLLGTFVEVGVVSSGDDVDRIIDRTFAKIIQLQQLLSFQQPESDISRLNSGNGSWMPMHAESLRVLKLAQAMTRRSSHLFNCTVGGALVTYGVLPNHDAAQLSLAPTVTLPCGIADDIEISATAARLKRPVKITLDGIAKGYAVDAAIAVLKRNGVAQGWVNAGGDMRAFGDVVVPVVQRQADGSMKSLGGLRQAAIATSRGGGDIDQQFPGLIVAGSQADADKRVDSEVVSVIARFAWRADALTKVAALLPVARRTQVVAELGGMLVEGVAECAA